MTKPPFSPEWSQNGWDSPLPNGHDRRIPDRLGHGIRGQTGMWSLDTRVPLLAHKFPGTDSLSHFSQGVSCDCQDGQHGGSIPYKLPGEFMVTHPKQACTPSPPLDSVSKFPSFSPWEQFMFRESWTSQPTFCQDRSSGQGSGPSNSSPDLRFVRQSANGPLCVTGVVQMPALILPLILNGSTSFPAHMGIDALGRTRGCTRFRQSNWFRQSCAGWRRTVSVSYS